MSRTVYVVNFEKSVFMKQPVSYLMTVPSHFAGTIRDHEHPAQGDIDFCFPQ